MPPQKPASAAKVGRTASVRALLVASCVATACGGESASREQEKGASREDALYIAPDAHCRSASLGSRDYWVCDDERSWATANAYCSSVGMSLVAVNNAAENAFLVGLGAKKLWIGGTDSAVEGTWRWPDASQFWKGTKSGSAPAGVLTAWATNEPNNVLNEDCTELDPATAKWNDIGCLHNRAYACEGEFEDPTPLTKPDVNCALRKNGPRQYWVCTTPRSWGEARARCIGTGTDLAAIDNKAENEFLRAQVTNGAYVGLNDQGEEGIWKWTADNATTWCGEQDGYRSPQSYTNWAAGSPQDHTSCTRVSANEQDYLTCADLLDWKAAQGVCAAAGMALAKIDDSAELALVSSAMQRTSCGAAWLGGTDALVEDKWLWSDGSAFWSGGANGTAPAGKFTSWNWTEPNNLLDEDCLELQQNGKWNDKRCDSKVGFVCEGPSRPTAFPQTADTHDCALVNPNNGTWSESLCSVPRPYVCEVPPPRQPPAQARLSQITTSMMRDFQTGWPDVGQASFAPQFDVRRPFLTHEAEFGLRPCLDFIEETSSISRSPDQETVGYQQTYRRIPLYGQGYRGERQASTKALRSIIGSITHGVEAAAEVKVTLQQANQLAATELGVPLAAINAAPPANLTFMPARKTWELAWLFRLLTKETSHAIGISAATGRIMHHTTGIQQDCSSIAANKVLSTAQDVVLSDAAAQGAQFDTTLASEPKTTTLSPTTDTAGLNFAVQAKGYQPSFTSAQTIDIYASCPGDTTDRVPAIQVGSTGAATLDPNEHDHVLAGMMRSAQTCADFFADSLHTRDERPWTGPSGTGGAIRLGLNPGAGYAAWNEPYQSLVVDPTLDRYQRAPLDIICHEFGHGVTRAVTGTGDPVTATENAMHEALSDISAIAAEAWIERPEATLWCLGNDHDLTATCGRDAAVPEASSPSEVRDPFGSLITDRLPRTIGGPRWCPYDAICPSSAPECCTPHHNSTVLSHWFYMITKGTSAEQREDGCSFTVPALDPLDLHSSIRDGYKIVTLALRDFLQSGAALNLPAFSLATVDAAKSLYQNDEAARAVRIVKSAWLAAGMTREWTYTAKVAPEPQTEGANPWLKFTWPSDGAVEWDLQISIGRTPNWVTPTHQAYVTERDTNDAGESFAFYKLALSESMSDLVFWRYRQHGTSAWECQPVYSFIGTDKVKPTTIRMRDAENGKVPPGSTRIEFTPVDGAVEYRVFISPTNTGCVAGNGIVEDLQEHLDGVIRDSGVFLSGGGNQQPNRHYFANVLPIGPKDFNGVHAVGPCTTLEFETGPLPPPVIQYPWSPPGGTIPWFNYKSPHQGSENLQLHWRWYGNGGPASYRLTFYRRDATGACEAAPAKTFEIADSRCIGTQAFCEVVEARDLFPVPWPAGYCWTVTSIAEDGTESAPSDYSLFSYEVFHARGLRPGPEGPEPFGGTIIPGNSYGKPVTFAWEPVPGAVSYRLILDRWFREKPQYTQDTTDLTITVPGEIAGVGRYAWTAQALMPDPDNLSVAASAQAPVPPNTSFYVVGPGPATFYISNPPNPNEPFVQRDLVGRVELPFVPNQQYEIAGSSRMQMGPACQTRSTYFPGGPSITDTYDCSWPFTIVEPEQRTRYGMQYRSWNFDEVGQVFNLPDVWQYVTTLGCGRIGESCCGGATCEDVESPIDREWLQCNNSYRCECVPLTRDEACGYLTECGPSNRNDGCGGTVDCGSCSGNYSCKGGACIEGEPQPPPTQPCDATVTQGGNDPEEHVINLGKSAGVTRLTVNTFDIPDLIAVTLEGSLIAQSDCIKTSGTLNVCLATGWCCDGEVCYKDISYSGASQMTVSVMPNCNGDDDTRWEFSLSCP